MKLVSAIMPTRGRGEMAARALQCFLSQTYPNKELIILDDADDRSFDMEQKEVPDGPMVYRVLEKRLSIPKKRNLANGYARGEIIWHLDSDDWSAPERMAEQVKLLEESGKAVTGYSSILFYGEAFNERLKYLRFDGAQNYAVGTSLTYTRQYWANHPFKESQAVGEDSAMVYKSRAERELIAVPGHQMIVARVHPGNTSKKDILSPDFRRVTRADFPPRFFDENAPICAA